MAGETVAGVRDGPDCGGAVWDSCHTVYFQELRRNSGVNSSVETTASAAGEAGSECAIKCCCRVGSTVEKRELSFNKANKGENES